MRRQSLLLTLSMLMASGTALASHQPVNLITDGSISGNFLLRYEGVEEQNLRQDGEAMTFRTRLDINSGRFHGFSFHTTLESSTNAFGYNEYSVDPVGYNPGEYSVIPDPEHSEVDQAYIQYRNGKFNLKAGRHVIVLNNQRHLGHVAWRNDRQTFDAVSVDYQVHNNLDVSYSVINKRNRIFADVADVESDDRVFNIGLLAFGGQFQTYGIELSDDAQQLDTYGISFKKSFTANRLKWRYFVDVATQESTSGAGYFVTDYGLATLGVTWGYLDLDVGFESLGSDLGQGSFATPLATLHIFNGLADKFLTTPTLGLEDTHVSVSLPVNRGKFTVAYHDYKTAYASPLVNDLGSEVNVQYLRKLGRKYKFGVKYADYTAGDIKDNTEKFWVWLARDF